jgi:hypothetical protein
MSRLTKWRSKWGCMRVTGDPPRALLRCFDGSHHLLGRETNRCVNAQRNCDFFTL